MENYIPVYWYSKYRYTGARNTGRPKLGSGRVTVRFFWSFSREWRGEGNLPQIRQGPQRGTAVQLLLLQTVRYVDHMITFFAMINRSLIHRNLFLALCWNIGRANVSLRNFHIKLDFVWWWNLRDFHYLIVSSSISTDASRASTTTP